MQKTVTIKGVAYGLRFTFEALCRMRERHGLNALSEEAFVPDPRTIAILVWGGVLHEAPKITLEDVYCGLDVAAMRETTTAVYEALVDALPKKQPAQDVAYGAGE